MDSKINEGTLVEIFIPTKEITIADGQVKEKKYGNIFFLNKDDSTHRLITEELSQEGYNVYETALPDYDLVSNDWKLAIIDPDGFDFDCVKKRIDDLLQNNYFDKIIILFEPEENNPFLEYSGKSGAKLFAKPVDKEIFMKILFDWLNK
jgi:hypothetical protein